MSLMNQLEDCKTDGERWTFLMANKDSCLTVMLDNDDTFIVDENDEDAECVTFDGYIGNAPGITDLLMVIGVSCEDV